MFRKGNWLLQTEAGFLWDFMPIGFLLPILTLFFLVYMSIHITIPRHTKYFSNLHVNEIIIVFIILVSK